MIEVTIQKLKYRRYGCAIYRHRKTFVASDAENVIVWDNYSYEQYNKWRWYFRYRKALEQVKTPKQRIELREFTYDFISEEDAIKKALQSKLISAKGRLTTWKNKLDAYKAEWNSLFPIENDESYMKAVEKINGVEQQIQQLQDCITGKAKPEFDQETINLLKTQYG